MIQLNLLCLPDAAKAWAALTGQMFCFTCFTWQRAWSLPPWHNDEPQCKGCYLKHISEAIENVWH